MTTPGPAPPARGQQVRVLVTAASKYGATAGIARAIAEALTEHGVTATVREPEAVDSVNGYDAVVLGSAVYSGHWLEPAKELVARFRDALAERPVWLFSSGPVGDPSSKLVQKMGEDPLDVAGMLAATRARGHQMFAGKLDRRNLGFAPAGRAAGLPWPGGLPRLGRDQGVGRRDRSRADCGVSQPPPGPAEPMSPLPILASYGAEEACHGADQR